MVVAGSTSSTGIINQNGGTITTGLLFLGGGFATSLGDPVPGGNGTMTMAAGTHFTVADQFTMASVPGGNGTLTNSGGTIAVGGSGFLASDPTGTARVTLNNGTWTVADQLQIGGSGGDLGGNATVTLNNSNLTVGAGTGLLAVYQTSTLIIGSTAQVNGDTGVDGWIQYDSGTFNTTGTLSVAGRVQLSTAARGVNGSPTNKKTLEAGKLDFTTSGIIDLNDNDALIHNNTLAEVENFVRTGRNGGLWTGTMLTSTAAKNNGLKTTGLGVVRGSEYSAGNGGTTSFNGRALANTDVVVKYTYNGDTELNGKVDGGDYARIDTTFNNQLVSGNIGGWFNGDFDFNGKVDGADYALADAAFNSQGSVVLGRPGEGALAGPENVVFVSTGMDGAIAGQATSGRGIMLKDELIDGASAPAGSVVPEPSMLGLAGVSMLGAMARRRRSR
jgi:hypothetical protein